MWGLFGIHTMPPDSAVVPPTTSPFSNSPTVAPAPRAASAATSPAAPVPSTTTSKVSLVELIMRNLPSRADGRPSRCEDRAVTSAKNDYTDVSDVGVDETKRELLYEAQ